MTFKSELLCGQGNANDCLTANHRHWIFPLASLAGFPSIWWLVWHRLAAGTMPTIYGRILFPVSLPSLSSLYCISIPGPAPYLVTEPFYSTSQMTSDPPPPPPLPPWTRFTCDPAEIGRARVGKECRSRWSPYH